DRAAPAAEMDDARRRNRHLRGRARRRFEEAEILRHDRLGPRQLAVDAQARSEQLDVALGGAEARLDARRDDGDVGKLLDEIEMPPGAAELAVGDAAIAEILLQPHHLADAIVLDRAQAG